jgi:hypothetical protein
MANSTEREPRPFRLEMDNREVVEVDGSTVVDEDSGREVPAVVLRLPPWRAHSLGHVLADWTMVSDLFDGARQASLDEGDLAWALYAASSAAGDPRARQDAQRPPTSVSSGQRAAAAAVLRGREAFEVHTVIAVVDAAAWWLDQPHGDNYCSSLLNAVTDQQTAAAAYLELVGGNEEPPEQERSG